MTVFKSIRNFTLKLQQRILSYFVKVKIIGKDPKAFVFKRNDECVYALLYPSHAERLLVDNLATQLLGWSSPLYKQTKEDSSASSPGSAFFHLYQKSGIALRRKPTPVVMEVIDKKISWLKEQKDRDIKVIPVRVFWGREPQKERSFLKIWLQNSGTIGGRLATIMAILFNGRNTFVHFSDPISLNELSENVSSSQRAAHKLARILRVHNKQVTSSVIGPELSHRRTLVHKLPSRALVQKAILKEVETKKISKAKARKRALKYADEIASNISYTAVRFMEVLLSWLWNKLYNGVRVHNLESLKTHTQGYEIIYVPCHRSHIDYLLLSYVLYTHGLQLPQVAAGINLNIPIIGSILRRGGAFFLRRSFKDNPLYSAVFDEYLHSIFSQGYSAEYFVEGGRSRTGRTLTPKAGMLAMTLRSYLRDSEKPIVFIPVYTGYEKVLEANSYLNELRGQAKKKESLIGLLRNVRALKNSFGKVNVTFGNPLYLSKLLDEFKPGWQQHDYSDVDYKPDWAFNFITLLCSQVATGINQAASINPINLLALALLPAQRQARDEQQLMLHMQAYRGLMQAHPYSDLLALPEGSAKSWIEHAQDLNLVKRNEHELGDIIQTDERQAILLTYYRNNVLHLFAMPSLISCLFINNRRFNEQQAQQKIALLYPFLKAELFLIWSLDEVSEQVSKWLEILCEQGYLMKNELGYHSVPASDPKQNILKSLAEHVLQTLTRYYLTLKLLELIGSERISFEDLEKRCTLLAQRITLLYGMNAPEFFDKNLFRTLINQLLKENHLTLNEDKKLCFGKSLGDFRESIEPLLSGELQQSIVHVANNE